MKKEHESFELLLSEDGQYFTQSYDGGLVIQTLDAYRAKNPKVFKMTHGCEGELDDACILARHIAGECLVTISNNPIDGKEYSKVKVNRAVSVRYNDDKDRILGLYDKFSDVFRARGILSKQKVAEWVDSKRKRYEELDKLVDKANPRRPHKCTIESEENQESVNDADWVSRDGETVFLNTNILVMKQSSNLELVDKSQLADLKRKVKDLEEQNKDLQSELDTTKNDYEVLSHKTKNFDTLLSSATKMNETITKQLIESHTQVQQLTQYREESANRELDLHKELAECRGRLAEITRERDRLSAKLSKNEGDLNLLYFALGNLYNCLPAVRDAHYTQGYNDAAYFSDVPRANAKLKSLLSNIKNYPQLLADATLATKEVASNLINDSKDKF